MHSDYYNSIYRLLSIESAGLLWLAAEIALLFALLSLNASFRCDSHIPKRTMRRAALAVAVIFACIAAAVYGRYYQFLTADTRFAVGTLSPEALAMFYRTALYQHLVIWAAFVSLWVILEISIVVLGVLLYYRVRATLEGLRPLRLCTKPIAILILCATLFTVAAHAQSSPSDLVRDTIQAIESEAAPYRNAVYLYLRLAGIVWITVEWIAAVYLIAAFRLIKRLVAGPTHA